MIGAVISGVAAFGLLGTDDQPQAGAEIEVAASLDALHAAAARADAPAYFDRLDPDLVWIGNDVSERWTHDEFLAFAAPHFEDGEGWAYSIRARRVWMAPDPCECLAWADEDGQAGVIVL